MTSHRLIFLLFALFLRSEIALAEAYTDYNERNTNKSDTTVIHIAAANLTNLVEENETGVYQKLFKLASSNTNFSTRETHFPFRRALAEFKAKHVDCTYSFTEVLEDSLGKDAVIASYPLGAFFIYMFTQEGSTPLRSIEQLYGMKVGGINGQEQYFKNSLPKDLSFQILNTDQQGLEMLKLGRINVLIAALPDINPYLSELSFDKKYPIYGSFDRITCHNTEKNRAFLTELSPQLEKMKLDGAYKTIAGELYIDF